jgi:methylamine dehydrogenase light chain
MDRMIENLSRAVAKRTSRRSVLGLLGKALLGSAMFPLLPVRRAMGIANAAERKNKEGDPLACDYWRYCGFDGFLCSCCGGSITECAPGSIMSPTSWVGTCQNPVDGKEYIISYRDCCGKDFCNRCFCQNNKGDLPIYRTQLDNSVYWCFGTQSYFVNCTTAVMLGPKT